MTIALKGYVFSNLGTAKVGLTVEHWVAGAGAKTAPDATTDADGMWEFTGLAETSDWRIKIIDGLKVLWLDSRSKVQVTDLAARGVVTGTTKFATTEVFESATPPAAFTDLDLSAVVGAKSRMVLLKVTNTTVGSAVNCWFRRNGESVTTASMGGTGYTSTIISGGTEWVYVIVPTDSAGVVEWRAAATAGRTVAINVEAYW